MRISSIDSFRAITIFYIIVVHGIMCYPVQFTGHSWFVTSIFITQGVRFAIPFFSIVAGYFFGKKIREGGNPQSLLSSYTGRLLSVLVFWSVVYLLFPLKFRIISYKIIAILNHPETLMVEGTKFHLWFLISLILSLGIVEIFVSRGQETKLILFSLILYFLGLLGGSYSFILRHFGIGIDFNTRNGPFFTTLFVAIGWFLSSGKFSIRPSFAVLVTVVGYALHMTEVFVLTKYSLVKPWYCAYVVGTILFGIGPVLLLLSKKDMGQSNLLSFMGKYTLGVYVSHIIFLDLIFPLRIRFHSLFVEMIYPFVVYALAFAATFSARRIVS